MKIAVAAKGKNVDGHFGGCEQFLLFETENGQITAETNAANPGHRPGFLPNFLADMGAEVVIAGGMGARATQIFAERGIEVFTGIEGDARQAVETYLKGELKSTGAVCQHHHDHDHDHDHDHGHDHGHHCGH